MIAVPGLKATALKAADHLSRFSVVLPQALSLCAREDDVSAGELATVADRDVVITGSLLSLANSAYYARGTPVTSLRNAIVRLGTRKTRNVLLGLSVARSFSAIEIPGKWSSVRFNAHSLSTAVFCDLIVQNALTRDSDWAFGAGLLHDIGLLLIAAAFPDHLSAFTEYSLDDAQLAEHERELLGFTHFELGADFLAKWNYPSTVQQAVRQSPSASIEFAKPFSLASVIRAATLQADSRGQTVMGAVTQVDASEAVLESLQIKDREKFLRVFDLEWEAFQQPA